MATTWGSIVNDGTKKAGRIGIVTSLSSTNTQTTVTIKVYFWSRYSVDDSSNKLYFDNEASSATTSRGACDIYASSNTSWSDSNKELLKTYTYTYTRGTSAKTIKCAAKLTGVDYIGATMYVTSSYTIPALASYKVSYNANGGSGAPGNQTKYYGKALTLYSTKPTRSGYTFVGWGTSASDTSADYSAGETIPASVNKTLVLYAIWKKTIKLTYSANGGSGAPSVQSATVWNATTSYKFTIPSTKPTRAGYTFLGWSTSSTATSATYSAGDTITLSSSDTLYAVWKVNTLTVNYYSNYATYCELDVAVSASTNVKVLTATFKYGTTYDNGLANYTGASGAVHMTRTGYTGTGKWNTAANGSGKAIDEDTAGTGQALASALGKDLASGSVTVNVYAQWTINSYKLTINPNGGTWNGSTADQSFTQNYNTVKSIPVPTRTGYTFVGWTLSGGGKISSTGAVTVNYTYGTSAGTLTAKWTINSYKLTVKPNGGTWNGSTADQSFTQNYNTTKSIPVPTWTGHTFSGWLLSGGGKIASTGAVATTYTFGASAGTLTARWDTNDYVVTFDAGTNGGAINGEETKNVLIEYNTAIGTLPTPTRKNYIFLGWYTAKSGGTKITSTYKITKDVTLYAQFEIDASAWVNEEEVWEEGVVYTNVDGTMKKGHAKVNVKGIWKDGLCK